jgi:Na+-driven multidrug efflux pump
VGIGAPSFLAGFGATLLVVVVNTTLSQVAAATAALAAFAICSRLQTFVAMPQLGISQGMQPIVGYNAGRRLAARVRRARTLSLRATLVYSAAAAGSVALLAEPITAAFVDDPAVQSASVDALRILAIGFAAAGVTPLVSAYFQALGRPRPSYALAVGTLLLVKVPLVLALGRTGPTGTWTGLAAGELLSAAIALVVLRRLDVPATRTSASADGDPDGRGHATVAVRDLPDRQ